MMHPIGDVKDLNGQSVTTFDDALMKLGFGRFNYILILLSGVIITASSFETLGISFVFPVAECDLQLTTVHKGILSGVTSIGIIVSSHLWGFAADYKGRKVIIVPTLMLSFLSTFFSSLATNFTVLMVCRFFSGFFIAGSSATIYAYLGEFHCSQNRSKAIMAASFVYGVACNFMPVLGFLLLNRNFSVDIPLLDIEFKPWRLYLLACGLPSFICAIILLYFPESPKFTFSKGKDEETLKILKEIYKINNPSSESAYDVTKIVEDSEFADNNAVEIVNVSENPFAVLWKQTCLLFSGDNLKKTVLVCVLQCGLFGSCHGLYMFFPEIIDKITAYSNDDPSGRATICQVLNITDGPMLNDSLNGLSTDMNVTEVCSEKFEIETFGHSLVMELLYMIGFLIITFTINRTSKLTILLVICFGCGISGLATLVVNVPIVSVYVYVTFMLTFLAVNIVNAAIIDLFPTNLRGMAINIAMMFGRIGSVFGTNIVGLTLDQHCSMTFAVSAAVMCLCGVLSFFIPKINHINGRKAK